MKGLSLAGVLILFSAPAFATGSDEDSRAETEQRITEIISQDGVHVVHFWAPWCVNSTEELRRGLYEVIEEHPEVTFTFVTIWNDGESGRDTMDRFAIASSVEELVQADRGPSDLHENRHREFLGLPVTWIPTTWIFHKNGELAFAFNYGEMEMDDLRKFIRFAARDWSHN